MNKLGFILMVTLLFSACASYPDSPAQSIAASYITVETLAESTAIAYQDGHIDEAEKGRIKGQLNTALRYIALGEQMLLNGGDPQTYMTLAMKLLTEVAEELAQ